MKLKYNKPYQFDDSNVPNKHMVDYKWRERKTDKCSFMLGKVLPCPDMGQIKTSTDPKDYDLVYHSEIPPEMFLKYGNLPNNAMALLFRKDVVDLLKDFCPNDFQDFPATIVSDNPKKIGEFENHDYRAINITHLADVFDHEKTNFHISQSDPIMILGTRYSVFKDAECLEGHHIVRDQTLKSHIMVSPEFVALFKKHKIKGCRFLTDETGDLSMRSLITRS